MSRDEESKNSTHEIKEKTPLKMKNGRGLIWLLDRLSCLQIVKTRTLEICLRRQNTESHLELASSKRNWSLMRQQDLKALELAKDQRKDETIGKLIDHILKKDN